MKHPQHLDAKLLQATQLLRRKEYAKVQIMLAPQIFIFRNNAWYFFIYGLACLYANDLDAAYSHLKRSEDIFPQNHDTLLALSILLLRMKEETKSLQILLEIQEMDNSNIKANRALDMIKLAPENTDWNKLGRQGSLDELLPTLPWAFYIDSETQKNIKTILKYIGIGIAVIVFLIFLFFGLKNLSEFLAKNNPIKSSGRRPEAVVVNEQANISEVESSNDIPEYYFTQIQIQNMLSDLKNHFANYRDNEARLLVNKLLVSNANRGTKNEVKLLLTHLKTPNFTNFKTNYPLVDVQKKPGDYSGIHVMWRGMVDTVQKDQQGLMFQLLVGYEKSSIVEGTVLVKVQFPVELKNGDAVELIGQIQLNADNILGFFLQASSIRPIIAHK
jgi:tetratricopeptide (TPR) repeat protein